MKSTRGILFSVLLMALGTSAGARDWYVSSPGTENIDGGVSWENPSTLRHALTYAVHGDTLRLRAITYTTTIHFETDQSIAIVVEEGGGRAVIRFLNYDRGFIFRSESAQSVLLRGIEIDGGNATNSQFKPHYGGAIYVGASTTLTMDDGAVTGSKATSDASDGYGGAIYNEGKLHMRGVLLSGNMASEKGSGYGGALYNSGTVSISGGTKFQNNSASRCGELAAHAKGGAIYSAGAGSRVQIEGTREGEVTESNGVFFVENIAGEIVDEIFEQWAYNDRIAYGGAICGTDGTVLDIAGARFEGNKASLSNMIGKGGAIYVDEKIALSVYNTVFAKNIAAKGRGNQVAYGEGYGGAICLLDEDKYVAAADTPRVNVERSLFHGNTASCATAGWGGAVYGIGAYRSVHTDYTENVADSALWGGYGGAIYIPHGVTFIIEDALFSGNTAVVRGVGNKGYGGAIWTAGSLHLKNVTMEKNVASKNGRFGHGGAIYLTQTQTSTTAFFYPYGKLYLEGTNLFKGNVALWGDAEEPAAADDFVFPAFGGAIAVEGSTRDGSFINPVVTLNSSSIYFEDNVAAKGIGHRAGGGAIGVYGANVAVGDDLYAEDIVFRNNVAADNVNNPSPAYGGAIMLVKVSQGNMEGLTLFAAKFFGNVATMSLTGEGRGGAVADAGGQFINISRGRFEANYANGNEASTGNAWGGAFASFCPGNGWSSASEINFGGESLIAIGHDDGPPLCNNMATLGKGNGYGGAISVTNGSYLSLSDRIRIEDNKADMGGGLYFSTEDNSSASAGFQLQEAIFQRNSAERGGGIWTEQLGFLKIVEQPFHDQQTWIRNNTASEAGDNIYPVEGVCTVTTMPMPPEVSCVPEYGTYAVLYGKPLRLRLESPEGWPSMVVERGIGKLNPTAVEGSVHHFSYTARREAADLICTRLIPKALLMEFPEGMGPVFFVGEKIQMSYTLNQFLAPFLKDWVQWKTTDYGVASIDETGLITAKEPGSTYISAGIRPDFTPEVEMPEAFTGDVHETDVMHVYVIDTADLTLKKIERPSGDLVPLSYVYYADEKEWLSLPPRWEEVAGEYSALSWELSDPTMAELEYLTNGKRCIHFKKTGHIVLRIFLKARPECRKSYDFFVVDPLRLSGIKEGGIYNVGTELLCEVSEMGLPEGMRELEWVFSNSTVARVGTDYGSLAYVRMEAFGTTTLTVRLKAIPNRMTAPVTFYVAQLSLDMGDVIREDEWMTGTANILPAELVETTEVIWERTPADDSLTEWHWNGNTVAVRGLRVGEATVSVRMSGSDLSDSVRLRIIGDARIVGPSVFPMGESAIFTVSSEPELPDAFFVWSSDNETVARIDMYDGKLDAMSRGSATITATCSRNPALVLKHTVTVKDVAIRYAGNTFLPLGGTAFFTLPDDLDPAKVHWQTSNGNIVNVDDYGTVTVGDTPGMVTVSAILLEDPLGGGTLEGVQYTIYAVKLNPEVEDVPLGAQVQFRVQADPTGVVNSTSDVIWSSSSPAITMDSEGRAQAVSRTSEDVAITVSLKANPAVKATAMVKVDPVQRLTIKTPAQGTESFTYDVGQLYDFDVLITPETAVSTVLWSSLTPDIVSVDGEGWVTVLGAGTAQIRVATPDGRCADTCEFYTVSGDLRIILDATSLSLYKGETHILRVIGKEPEDFPTDGKPLFTSEKPQVATIDPVTGEIKAVDFGETLIAVTFASGTRTFKAQCHVVVENAVTGIDIGEDTLVIDRNGASVQLPIVLTPSDATDKTLVVESSHPEVATVSATGRIYPVSDGQTVITVQAGRGKFLKTRVVKVQALLHSVRLNTHALTMNQGSVDYLLHAVYEPIDVSVRPSLQWASGDASIVSVDENGMLSPQREGKTFIRMSVQGHTFADTCWVSVVRPLTGLSIDKTRVKLTTGTSAIITPIISPSNVTANLQWRTTNVAVATVVPENGTCRVLAHSAGTVLITAKTEDGAFSASCVVTVESVVEEVSLSRYNLALPRGESQMLRAEITPSDAYRQTITWSSSDSSVATVSASGKVTALKAGSAYIMAKTENGVDSAACQVSVSVPVQGISLSWLSNVLSPYEEFSLIATISPEDASSEGVFWTVSDPTMLEKLSSNNGKVCYFRAKEKSGLVRIQAESSDSRVLQWVDVFVSGGTLGVVADPESASGAAKCTAFYHEGSLRLNNMAGFQVYLATIHGKICGAFRVTEAEEERLLNLPAGIYILTARKGEEQFSFKFIAR